MSVPAQPTMPDMGAWLDSFLDAFGGVDISKETIDALAMALAIYQTQHAMAQVEVAMQRVGVDQQQIELEKARIQFEMEEKLPFQREQMDFQREQMQLESQMTREKMENDRLLMEERTKQAKSETLQAAIGEAIARTNQAAAFNQATAQLAATQGAGARNVQRPYYHASPFRVNNAAATFGEFRG